MKSQAHRDRMDERRRKQRSLKPDRKARAFANVGRDHPDYGLHPHEHLKRKEAR